MLNYAIVNINEKKNKKGIHYFYYRQKECLMLKYIKRRFRPKFFPQKYFSNIVIINLAKIILMLLKIIAE